jgi:hypothetical protein
MDGQSAALAMRALASAWSMRAIAAVIARLSCNATLTRPESSLDPNLDAISEPDAIGVDDFGFASLNRAGGGTLGSGFSQSRLHADSPVVATTMDAEIQSRSRCDNRTVKIGPPPRRALTPPLADRVIR